MNDTPNPKPPIDVLDHIIESRRAWSMGDDELLGRGILAGIVGVLSGGRTDGRALAYFSELAMRRVRFNDQGKPVYQEDAREIDVEAVFNGVANEIRERTEKH